MLKHLVIALAISVFGALVAPNFVMAQSADASDLSEEEMRELFKNQKSRGLILAPTNAKENTEEKEAASESTPSPETYVELAPEEQVNIQISFDFDSSALRSDQKPKLATLCNVMKSFDQGVFRVVGHTDASGSAGYNDRLSLLRAQEVKRFLVSDCGIAETRLEAVGVGEGFPLNKDDPNGDINRRVEFQALS